MKTILLEHVTIVTCDPNQTVIDDGYIAIREGKIQGVGVGVYPGNRSSFDERYNGSGKVALPGFVNTHGHAAMTLLRGYADDLPLMAWLKEAIWPVEDQLSPDDIYWGTQLAVMEMLLGGTTCFTDMYFHMDKVAETVEQAGIRAVLARGMIGNGPAGGVAKEESRDFVKSWNRKGNGRILTTLGPHAPYTCPPEFLHAVAELSAELQVPIQIHLSETVEEVAECRKNFGMSPVELVNSTGLFERPTIAAHCVHVSEEDMDILAEKKVSVAHNPGSNLKLGSGIAPVDRMQQKGIVVGLGTDGAASNNNLDMMEEMRLAALLHKGVRQDPMAIPADQALCMATVQGARALFLEDRPGTIEVGAPADIVLLSLEGPHMKPHHNVVAHIVYASHAGDVRDVMVGGDWLVRNRECLTLDQERIYREVEAIRHRLFP